MVVIERTSSAGSVRRETVRRFNTPTLFKKLKSPTADPEQDGALPTGSPSTALPGTAGVLSSPSASSVPQSSPKDRNHSVSGIDSPLLKLASFNGDEDVSFQLGTTTASKNNNAQDADDAGKHSRVGSTTSATSNNKNNNPQEAPSSAATSSSSSADKFFVQEPQKKEQEKKQTLDNSALLDMFLNQAGVEKLEDQKDTRPQTAYSKKWHTQTPVVKERTWRSKTVQEDALSVYSKLTQARKQHTRSLSSAAMMSGTGASAAPQGAARTPLVRPTSSGSTASSFSRTGVTSVEGGKKVDVRLLVFYKDGDLHLDDVPGSPPKRRPKRMLFFDDDEKNKSAMPIVRGPANNKSVPEVIAFNHPNSAPQYLYKYNRNYNRKVSVEQGAASEHVSAEAAPMPEEQGRSIFQPPIERIFKKKKRTVTASANVNLIPQTPTFPVHGGKIAHLSGGMKEEGFTSPRELEQIFEYSNSKSSHKSNTVTPVDDNLMFFVDSETTKKFDQDLPPSRYIPKIKAEGYRKKTLNSSRGSFAGSSRTQSFINQLGTPSTAPSTRHSSGLFTLSDNQKLSSLKMMEEPEHNLRASVVRTEERPRFSPSALEEAHNNSNGSDRKLSSRVSQAFRYIDMNHKKTPSTKTPSTGENKQNGVTRRDSMVNAAKQLSFYRSNELPKDCENNVQKIAGIMRLHEEVH